MLTSTLLQRVYGIRSSIARGWTPHLLDAVTLADLSNRIRLSAFLSQVGEESGCLRYVRELWGPTTQQKRYDPNKLRSRAIRVVAFFLLTDCESAYVGSKSTEGI